MSPGCAHARPRHTRHTVSSTPRPRSEDASRSLFPLEWPSRQQFPAKEKNMDFSYICVWMVGQNHDFRGYRPKRICLHQSRVPETQLWQIPLTFFVLFLLLFFSWKRVPNKGQSFFLCICLIAKFSTWNIWRFKNHPFFAFFLSFTEKLCYGLHWILSLYIYKLSSWGLKTRYNRGLEGQNQQKICQTWFWRKVKQRPIEQRSQDFTVSIADFCSLLISPEYWNTEFRRNSYLNNFNNL